MNLSLHTTHTWYSHVYTLLTLDTHISTHCSHLVLAYYTLLTLGTRMSTHCSHLVLAYYTLLTLGTRILHTAHIWYSHVYTLLTLGTRMSTHYSHLVLAYIHSTHTWYSHTTHYSHLVLAYIHTTHTWYSHTTHYSHLVLAYCTLLTLGTRKRKHPVCILTIILFFIILTVHFKQACNYLMVIM